MHYDFHLNGDDRIVRGQVFSYAIQNRADDGVTPISWIGFNLRFVMTDRSTGATVLTASTENGKITWSNQAGGDANLVLDAVATQALPVGTYDCKFEQYSSASNNVGLGNGTVDVSAL